MIIKQINIDSCFVVSVYAFPIAAIRNAKHPIIILLQQVVALITASTMNNINRNTNTTITSKNKNNEYGIIAHALLERGYNLSTRFFIDVKQKKIRIIVSSGSFYDSIIAVGVHNDWEFEWNFRE